MRARKRLIQFLPFAELYRRWSEALGCLPRIRSILQTRGFGSALDQIWVHVDICSGRSIKWNVERSLAATTNRRVEGKREKGEKQKLRVLRTSWININFSCGPTFAVPHPCLYIQSTYMRALFRARNVVMRKRDPHKNAASNNSEQQCHKRHNSMKVG